MFVVSCFEMVYSKMDILAWDDFAKAFEAKYWSREMQCGIKQRLDIEKYWPHGNLCRAEYFTE